MVVNDKTVALCDLSKPFVMVSPVPASVLDAMDISIVVTELMLKGGTDILDWTIKGPSSNVDLMGATQGRNPRILSQGEVTIGSGGTLDCYSGSGKFPRKIVLVEQVEDVIQIACYSVIGCKLFHGDNAPFNTVVW